MSRLRRMLSGKPVHEVGADGKMALSDHFRELRARVLRCAMVTSVFFAVALVFNRQVLDFLAYPYNYARENLPDHVRSELYTPGLASGILVPLTVSALVAVVLTAPYWLYQIWAFILPGLHAKERKWSRVFAAIAGPLFILGAGLAILLMPRALQFMISLTPASFTQRIDFDDYISFLWRTTVAFGLAFQIPVFVVLLNRVGVLAVETISGSRAWVILATFVFSAVATPTADPFTMLALALPMWVLFEIATLVCRYLEKRDRAKLAT